MITLFTSQYAWDHRIVTIWPGIIEWLAPNDPTSGVFALFAK